MSVQGAIRSRKRDEKVKFDPNTFRDELVSGINSCSNIEEVKNYLVAQGDSMDYRRYAEQFFDIFIAGGILAPGGSVIECEKGEAEFCVFKTDGSDEQIKEYFTALNEVLQRFKYLMVSLEKEEMPKVLRFIKAFSPENMHKLATFVALLNSSDLCSSKVLEALFIEALTKDDTAEKFIAAYFQAWLRNASLSSLASSFKKNKLDKRLEELFPANKRSFEYMRERFAAYEGLDDIISWQASLRTASVKKELQQQVVAAIVEEEKESDELIEMVNAVMEENYLKPRDMVPLVFSAVFSSVSWNKKFDLMTEQALKQINKFNKFLRAYTRTQPAQVILLLRLQNYCVDSNQALMKIFDKMVLLMYKLDIVSEPAVLEWFHEKHTNKGKTILLPQIEPMLQWFATADEEE